MAVELLEVEEIGLESTLNPAQSKSIRYYDPHKQRRSTTECTGNNGTHIVEIKTVDSPHERYDQHTHTGLNNPTPCTVPAVLEPENLQIQRVQLFLQLAPELVNRLLELLVHDNAVSNSWKRS